MKPLRQSDDYVAMLEAALPRVGLTELLLTKGSYIELYTPEKKLLWLKLLKGSQGCYFQSDCGQGFSLDEVTQLLETSELRVHCGQHTGMCALVIADTTTIGRLV